MAAVKTLPPRSKVKAADTWDLSVLFKNDAAWRVAYKKLEKQVSGYEKFKGKLGNSAKVVRACFDFDVEYEQLSERVGSYAYLKQSEDIANNVYSGMVQEYTFLATRAAETASYIAPELQALPKKKLDAYLKAPELKPYRLSLERLTRYKPHVLSLGEERLLAMQGQVAGSASRIFSQLTDADFKFGTVKDETGTEVELSQGSFRVFLESRKRSVRQAAFEKFYTVFEGHKNALAASLSSSVLQDVYVARARNYPSALEAALFPDNVPANVYTSLIEAVRGNIETVYRYIALRKRALKLKDVHHYDTYCGLVDLPKSHIAYVDAANQVAEAARPLGDEYVNTLRDGLVRARWVDRYENRGKRSGAFSGGGYFGPPYILMNYKAEMLDSMFTLAHEAGHSMHTHYSARNQPFQYYSYTIFVAEVASTFNEQLLGQHLLARAKDKKRRAQLVCREIDEIRGTIVRQTMFAEYEKLIHAIAERGEPLTVERLRKEYRALLEFYFGPGFVVDEALELEGLRIPHFYRAFYVYKYATGLSAAIALSRMVLNGGNAERERYLNFLKGGCSKYPLDLLRDAGVDLAKPEPVQAAMQRFAELVDELETLLD
jgi:oligoendopeptidase F